MNNKYHLAVSSFNGFPYSTDFITYYANFTTDIAASSKTSKVFQSGFVWPNEVTYISQSIVNQTVDPFGGLIASGGFLVPTKTKGGLYYFPFSGLDRYKIDIAKPIELSFQTGNRQDWFYHRVMFVDINGDGYANDLLTCRAYKPVFGSTKTELVAFVFNSATQKFEEHIIMKEACDVHFDVADVDNDGRFEIIAAGFFISQLNVIYSDHETNSFLGGNAKKKVIDSNAGQIFDVIIENLNSDKKLELIVTNHQEKGMSIKPALFYYKLNGSNIRDSTWERFTIYQNFPILQGGIKPASPGIPILVHPNLNDKSELAHILVAGDGAQYAYLFEPNTDSAGNLNYTLTWSRLFKNTVGGISVADLDGDGFSEFSVPSYDENAIYFFSFGPNKKN